MSVLLEIHLVVAFLTALCALIFTWNPQGRRVVNAVAGLQLLTGVALAAVMGMNHQGMPPSVWVHIVNAVVIMALYGLAIRYDKRAGGGHWALILGLAGFGLVLLNIAFGWKLVH